MQLPGSEEQTQKRSIMPLCPKHRNREACLEFSVGREEGRGKAAQAEGSGEWHWGRWQGPLSCRVMGEGQVLLD